eukprot:403359564
MSTGESLHKRSNETYKLHDEQYIIKHNSKDIVQYATFYWLRLQSLKPHVRESAELKWEKDQHLTYVTNILDIRPGQLTVIIGTIFKEMPLKPSILKNVLGVLGTQKFKHGLYVGEEDYAVLEDSSGRIRLKKGLKFNPDFFVSGSILGLKGVVDTNGFFEVHDHTYAGIPFSEPLPKSVNIRNQRDLYSPEALSDPKREFVALVSGLEFGKTTDVFSSEMLIRFFKGELGGPKNAKLASQISRVVICGNSIVQPEDTDQVLRGSYRVQNLNQRVYKTISDVLDTFELFLHNLSQLVDIDIMPGQDDFSSSFLPQQPLNSCLFPQLQDKQSINLVTNPHKFEMNGLQFLGCSGQNLNDIYSYTKGNLLANSTEQNYDALSGLQLTLEMRHVCPTAPDTLRAYPQLEEDPFIIDKAPHVYFAGNQAAYQEDVLLADNNQKHSNSSFIQGVKLISVPTFSQTKSIVLLDLSTLQSYEVKFDLSEGVMPSNQMIESPAKKASVDINME